jgi:hypothetical protein
VFAITVSVDIVSGPDWAEEVTAICALLVVLGLVGAVLQLAAARRARSVDTYLAFTRRWNEHELAADRHLVGALSGDQLRDKFDLARLPEPTGYYFACRRELDYWEALGNLYRWGSVSLRMIRSDLGGTVVREWQRWKPTIVKLREEEGGSAYEGFALLVEAVSGRHSGALRRFRRTQHGSTAD